MRRAKPELMIPAKNPEVLRAAIRYGADAVYIGGDVFGLRAKADNFSYEEMKESVEYAHARNKKVYVTVNILAHNEDLKELDPYLLQLEEIKPDGLIIADPAVFMRAGELCPDIERHISTQANNTNYGTFLFWHKLGATRVVTARELSLKEIREIRDNIPEDMEIETFIHGAMCISYSGRCLLSNYFVGKDANHGECTHPCRWSYSVMEESRPGEYLPVYENERGTYIFNSRDLCMVDHIPEMVEAGIDSFKIEGRMKNALYVANAARTYRIAIDEYFEDPDKYESRKDWYREAISDCTYRQFTTGFFFGKPGADSQIYGGNTYDKGSTYLGMVLDMDEQGRVLFEQRNKFVVGDEIEIMKPDGRDIKAVVAALHTPEGESREGAPHPKERLWITFCEIPDIEVGDILKRREK